MKTIDNARKLYDEYGRNMIHLYFPEFESKIAVGLAGHGSECFGFDDEISLDHDVNNGFCLWLTDEDCAQIGVELEKRYRLLPIMSAQNISKGGSHHTGVIRISSFYSAYTGTSGAPETWQHWLSLPSYALAEATNGVVWKDDLGLFSDVRKELTEGMPTDVWKKKIAARAAMAAQSGQYNYARCLAHSEPGAAMMALSTFAECACDLIYLLNHRYKPYYKWMFRGMDDLEKLGDYRYSLEYLLTGDNDKDNQNLKTGLIEDICQGIIKEMKTQGLTASGSDYLERHAYEVISTIENPEIRALHVMDGGAL